MSGISGLAAGIGAAAPGIAQGVGNMVQQGQANNAVQGINTQIANDPQMQQLQSNSPPAMDSAANPLTDPNHPAWGVMANMTGGQGGPLPGGNGGGALPVQMHQRGGVVGYEDGGTVSHATGVKQPAWDIVKQSVKNVAHDVFGGGAAAKAGEDIANRPAQVDKAVDEATGYQNGGLVRLNQGVPVRQPGFEKGPAVPVGPNNTIVGQPTARGGMLSMENGGPVPGESPTAGSTGLGQGITPASTDGIMKFDAGGVVPTGFVQQPGISGVPMTGRGASFVEGMQAGQNLGHNIQQAWLSHEARSANAEGAAAAASDTGVADQQPSALDKAKDAVEGFFHHLHGMSLDENSKPNSASAVPGSAGGATPGLAGAQSAAPGSIPPGPTAGQAGPAIPGAPPGAAAAPAGGATAAPPAAGAPVPAQQPGAPGPGAQPGGASPPGAGQPNGQSPAGGTTTPQVTPEQKSATLQAAQAAATDPQTRSGTPDQSPAASGLPHSLTTYQWDQSNQKIQQAVRAAAQAGEDPAKVYESLTAMRTAHIQGQVLRQYGAANVALQNGDMDAVKKALANANYYLPNGQGISFKTATQADVDAAKKTNPSDTAKVGDLMYRNPFYGMFGHENDQQFQTVTPMHLQMLGAAALDPRTVNQAITSMYSAQMEAQSSRMKAQGEADTGQGRLFIGQSDLIKAGVDQRLEAGRNYLNVANGEKSEAEASYWRAKSTDPKNGGQLKVTMNDYNKASQEAIASVRQNVQGKNRVVPDMVTGTNGKPVPNISPAAGRSVPNAGAVPSLYQGMSANTQQKVENLGAQLAGANIGMLQPQEAADVAARVVRWEESGSKSTHLDPATHTQQPDVILDGKSNAVHVWTGNGYRSVWATPNLDTSSNGGSKDEALPTSGPNAGAGGNSETNDFPNA